MQLIRIATASVNATVGAVRSNTDRLIEMAGRMAADRVSLGAFPEQVVGGYPPEDLIQWRAFVESQRRQLDRFASATSDLPTVFVVGVAVAVGDQLFNCAAVVHGGRILGLVPKEKLPSYEVFYEQRTFSRGGPGLMLDADGLPLGDYLFRFDFGTVAAEVCEDGWTPDGPMRRRCHAGAEIVVNVSSSPYRVGIVSTRQQIFATRSSDNHVTLVAANAVGSQDGLVFDGGGYVLQNGRLILDAPRLTEGYGSCVVDLDRTRRLRQENTTWRSAVTYFVAASSRCRSSTVTCPLPIPPACHTRRPAVAASSCRQPSSPPARRGTRCWTTSSRSWHSACATMCRRPVPFAYSAWHSPAAGIRC